MDQLLTYGLQKAMTAGAEFVELTAVEVEEKQFGIANARLKSKGRREASIVIRLIASGRWGFAAGPAANKTALARLVKGALAVAQVQPSPPFPRELSKTISEQGHWQGPCAIDPFSIPDSELAAVLVTADEALSRDGIELRQGRLTFRRQIQQYINSEGAANSQVFTLSGGGITVFAQGGGELQQRSWPAAAGSYAGGGFEYVEALALAQHGRRLAEEAVALAHAPSCPQGIFDVILSGPLLANQLFSTLANHLQSEGAGVSIGTVPLKQRLASATVSLIADATLKGGAGSYGYDSEGIKAQPFTLVEKGYGVNHFTGRESAAAAGQFSSGSMRFFNLLEAPRPGPSNLILKPGEQSLADLIKGIERGIMLATPRGPLGLSPNQRSFVAQAERGQLIEDGKLGAIVKNPFFRGNVMAFWNSCDGAAAASQQEMFGFLIGDCGISCRAAPLRFRGVRVGDGR